ncbi:MAG TPA: tripartite tricarboxylate transporter substrate binding protein [Alphaproteobacteria bacterium]|nr:tripartite tricarboxylate transporter substrate binding protein [Alphaproteobacteria bacterium]
MSKLGIARLVLIATVLIPGIAAAQDYPSKPIRWIVPFPPGGPTDLLARTVGQKLNEAWGQPVVIENKPGAAGNLGVDLAAKSLPDGYTLVIVPTGNITVNPTLFANLPYKPSDLAPVTTLATVENVVVINPSVPAKSLAELVALAKSKPGALTFASPGAGSQAHLAGELIKLAAGVDMLHVPYRGIGPALNDLLGGHVSMMFSQMSSALPHMQSGALRALGVASLKRSPVAPELPTIAEQGFPGFEATSWYALMVPANTPKGVIGKLHRETVRILQLPDVKDKLAGLGADPVGNSPEELATTIREESARWAEVIRKQGIKLD